MIANPLLDNTFLKALYQQHNKEVYAKIIALTKDEDPVEEIQGRISSGGSINIDGTSTMRRSCSLTMIANEMDTNNYYWGLNTKFQLEIGLSNTVVGYQGFDANLTYFTKVQDTYTFIELTPSTYLPNTYYFYNGEQYVLSRQYPDIIWFKEGRYVITSFSSSQSANAYTISLQGKDKMCLLNGEVSGSIYASVDFGKEEYEKKTYTKVELTDSKNYIDKYYYTTKGEYAVANIDYIMYEPNLYYILEGTEYKLCADKDFSSKKTYYYQVYNLATGEYDPKETYYKLNSVINIKSIPIKNIIKEAVHEYAQEPFGNIIINDLDDYGLELLEYRGDLDTPLYMIISENEDDDVHEVIQITLNGKTVCYLYDESTSQYIQTTLEDIPKFNPRITLDFSKAPVVEYSKIKLDLNQDTIYSVAKITYGETCGYRLTDITYAGDLISSVGETVTSILDKIVTMLGNFEYFYDTNGRFIFRKKQTYLDKSWNNIVDNDGDIYAESAMYTSADVWSFKDGLLISSFANNPSLNNVKNDYALWGTRTSVTGKELPVHLRYAIDKKPTYYKAYNGETYTTDISETMKRRVYKEYYDVAYADAKKDFLGFTRKENPIVEGKKQLSSDWWYMSDWYNYYKKLTNGTPPNDYVRLYATNRTGDPMMEKGYVENFCPGDYFPVEGGPETRVRSRLWLFHLIDGVYKFDASDVHGSGDSGIKEETDGTITVAPFSSCTAHHYNNFVDLVNGVAVDKENATGFFYKPNFPEVTLEAIEENATQYAKEHVEEFIAEHVHVCDWREIIYQMALDYRQHNHDDDFLIRIRENNSMDDEGEWYYPTGYTGYEQYYVDIEGFWRQLYDGTNWVPSVASSPESINFWFDFLDTDGDINKFSVKTVGDRSKSVNDNTIKAIYFREVPTTILCDNIATTERKSGYTYMQYIQGMEGLFNISSQGKSAKDVLDDYLYKYAYCIESVSINAIPLYHLEPNTRIFIEDKNSGINGEYLINKITIPLSYNGTMSISATKAIDRIY